MVPIFKKEEERKAIVAKMEQIKSQLEALGLTAKIDDRDNYRSGFKFAEWELKGVPVRLAIGPRDLENNTVEVARRDTMTKEVRQEEGLAEYLKGLMDVIQENIYNKALDFRNKNVYKVDTWDEVWKEIYCRNQ